MNNILTFYSEIIRKAKKSLDRTIVDVNIFINGLKSFVLGFNIILYSIVVIKFIYL